MNPSGKLPVTFAKSEKDLPHPDIRGYKPVKPGEDEFANWGHRAPVDIEYTEKLLVGYKWFDAEDKEPQFAFGTGLAYTTFAYSGLHAEAAGRNVTVSFAVKNTGKRAGKEIAEVYATLPASTGEPPKRLIGWEKVELRAGREQDGQDRDRPAVPFGV